MTLIPNPAAYRIKATRSGCKVGLPPLNTRDRIPSRWRIRMALMPSNHDEAIGDQRQYSGREDLPSLCTFRDAGGSWIHPGTSIIGRALLHRLISSCSPPFLGLRSSVLQRGAYRPSLRPVDQKIGMSLHLTSRLEPSSHVGDLLHDLLHGRAVADKVLGFSAVEDKAVCQRPCVGDGEANFEGRLVAIVPERSAEEVSPNP